MSNQIYRVFDIRWGNTTYFKSWDSALIQAHKDADEFENYTGDTLVDRDADPNIEANIWWSKKHGEVIIIEKVWLND